MKHGFFVRRLRRFSQIYFGANLSAKSADAFFRVESVFHTWLNKMALPELIEIVPLAQPVRAEITVPGSKSITNRALILAALADGEVTLKGALWSEDTEIMFDCLQKLGFEVK